MAISEPSGMTRARGPSRTPAPTDRSPTPAPAAAARPVAVPGLIHATGPTVLRRRVSVRGHPQHLDQHGHLGADAERLVDEVDRATAKAYGQVINRPLFTGLGDLAATNGYIALWIERVREELAAPTGAMTASQFGYAIEALATYLLGNSAAGWTLTYQIASGPTRPDVVAKKDRQVLWVDLTADPSAGHIYHLKRWHQPAICPHPHAEVTYPPLDAGTRKTVLANAHLETQGNPQPELVDAAALQAQIAQARQRLAANLQRWRGTYADDFTRNVKSTRRFDDYDEASADALSRNSVYRWLNNTFPEAHFVLDPAVGGGGGRAPRVRVSSARHGEYTRPGAKSFSRAPIETAEEGEARMVRLAEERTRQNEQERLAGSILTVLGKAPAGYGLWSASVSQPRGIAFLEEHDPDDANKAG